MKVRIALATVLAIVAMGVSVLYTAQVQRSTASTRATEERLSLSVFAGVQQVDAGFSSFALTGRRQDGTTAFVHLHVLDRELGRLAGAASGDRRETAFVRTQTHLSGLLGASMTEDLRRPTAAQRQAHARASAGLRRSLVARMDAANAGLRARQAVLNRAEARDAVLTAPLVIVGLGILFAAAGLLTLRRVRRGERRAAEDRATQRRFGEAMQVSDTQTEAHDLLKLHLERSIPGTAITVLNRNNSADRLEATTALAAHSPLAERLENARPRACMAVRLSRPFHHGATSEEVLSCEVCGALASESTCQPLLVGGEVIGSVLAEHAGPVADTAAARIARSVAQAAPVLANLRNLAIAEMRAATDSLTGLPNRRAVDDTLLRMLAQAGRSLQPLSIILLDLDRFKSVNDTYGHDRGDEVLAGLSTRMREVLRISDFAGRSGGEEFVLFLPDTDRAGAVRLAGTLRASMQTLTVPGVDRPITASFGIASYPEDGLDHATLMRSADRALYTAKRAGRDRIEASSAEAALPPQVAPGVRMDESGVG